MFDFAAKAASFLLENMIAFVDLTSGAAWSVCVEVGYRMRLETYTVSHIRSWCPSKAAMPAWWTSLDVWFCDKSGQFLLENRIVFADLTCGAAWSVCWSWLQDETGDVNRFSHSQWVSEQGCNACMMDLLRCLILRQKRPVFCLRTWLLLLTWHVVLLGVCVEVGYRMRLET